MCLCVEVRHNLSEKQAFLKVGATAMVSTQERVVLDSSCIFCFSGVLHILSRESKSGTEYGQAKNSDAGDQHSFIGLKICLKLFYN